MPRPLVRVTLAACLALGLASCGPRVSPLLPGLWETDGGKCSLEFTPDGKVYVGGNSAPLAVFQFAKPFADFGIHPGRQLPITYKPLSETQLEVRGDYTLLLDKLSAGGTGRPSPEVIKQYHPRETLTYTVTADELTLTNDQNKALKFRRAKEP